MKKIFFLTLIQFLFTLTTISQTIKSPTIMVEYNFIDNTEYEIYDSKLIVGGNETIFETKLSKSNSDKPVVRGNEISINGKLIDQYQYVNNLKDSLYSFQSFDEQVYEIAEIKPKFNWDISYTESKKIKNYICNKATTSFRGRSYTAWYTTEIPIFSGPFKFSGLPGLILEISDDSQTFKWEATKIKTKNNKAFTIPFQSPKIQLKEYMQLVTEHLDKIRARIRGALPRGTEFKKPQDYRYGIEKVYEWEK